MADAIFALILFYSFVLGARRGFFKEVVQFLALVVGVALARGFMHAGGAWIHGKVGGPPLLAEAGAAVAIWVVAFFLTTLIGRLVLKKLQGRGVDDRLDEGAEAVADALGGDTVKGPVTLMTDPIASKTGIFYWSDKLLGALLGVAKGAVTGYLLFGLLIFADRAGWENRMAASIEGSWAARLYERALDPYLRSYPEYQIARSLGEMRGVARAVKENPGRATALQDHPELRALAQDERILALGRDAEIRQAWNERDLSKLLLNDKVRALLSDRELREKVARIDWARVRGDIEGRSPAGSGAAEPARDPGGAVPLDESGPSGPADATSPGPEALPDDAGYSPCPLCGSPRSDELCSACNALSPR